jgi:hypothetical protein
MHMIQYTHCSILKRRSIAFSIDKGEKSGSEPRKRINREHEKIRK